MSLINYQDYLRYGAEDVQQLTENTMSSEVQSVYQAQLAYTQYPCTGTVLSVAKYYKVTINICTDEPAAFRSEDSLECDVDGSIIVFAVNNETICGV